MSISHASWAPWKIFATSVKCAEMMPGLVKLLLLEVPAALRGAPQPSAQRWEQAVPESLVPTILWPQGVHPGPNLILGVAGSLQSFREC